MKAFFHLQLRIFQQLKLEQHAFILPFTVFIASINYNLNMHSSSESSVHLPKPQPQHPTVITHSQSILIIFFFSRHRQPKAYGLSLWSSSTTSWSAYVLLATTSYISCLAARNTLIRVEESTNNCIPTQASSRNIRSAFPTFSGNSAYSCIGDDECIRFAPTRAIACRGGQDTHISRTHVPRRLVHCCHGIESRHRLPQPTDHGHKETGWLLEQWTGFHWPSPGREGVWGPTGQGGIDSRPTARPKVPCRRQRRHGQGPHAICQNARHSENDSPGKQQEEKCGTCGTRVSGMMILIYSQRYCLSDGRLYGRSINGSFL